MISQKYISNTAKSYAFRQLLGDEYYEQFNSMLNDARKKANYYVSKDTEGMSKMDLYDFYNIGDIYRDEFRKE